MWARVWRACECGRGRVSVNEGRVSECGRRCVSVCEGV